MSEFRLVAPGAGVDREGSFFKEKINPRVFFQLGGDHEESFPHVLHYSSSPSEPPAPSPYLPAPPSFPRYWIFLILPICFLIAMRTAFRFSSATQRSRILRSTV